jgi:predicted 2-oxoglutarate/Fe(II)-dependent dioxygenase YbiX
MQKITLDQDVYLIKNFLSEAECIDFINQSEADGYEEATVTTLEGQKMIKGIRNNQRVLLNDFDLASNFWNRIKPFVTEKFDDWVPVSVNEQFRFYKYEVDERFNKHRDGRFRRNEKEESRLTLMVYLNDDFEGGETEFDAFTVQPEQGTALIFRHDIKHKGCKVVAGAKYAIRTDIMFQNEATE